jgi:hypothetical protein
MDQNKGKNQEKPFPFNIRNWLPNIDQNEIKSKLKNPNKLIRVINYNLLCDSLLPVSTHIKEHELSTRGVNPGDYIKIPEYLKRKSAYNEKKELEKTEESISHFQKVQRFI